MTSSTGKGQAADGGFDGLRAARRAAVQAAPLSAIDSPISSMLSRAPLVLPFGNPYNS
jgi:hypothetical protein